MKNNKNYTYGISSYFENKKAKDIVVNQNCNSSMQSIMSHSDNLVEGLQKKINQKIYDDQYAREQKSSLS